MAAHHTPLLSPSGTRKGDTRCRFHETWSHAATLAGGAHERPAESLPAPNLVPWASVFDPFLQEGASFLVRLIPETAKAATGLRRRRRMPRAAG